MAKFNFVANQGVEFAEHPDFESVEKPGPLVTWAKFEHDPELTTPYGEKRYSFATEDPKVAERVRKVEDYGIAEVKSNSSK